MSELKSIEQWKVYHNSSEEGYTPEYVSDDSDIDELVKISRADGWISVDDRLPDYGQPVLIKLNGFVQHVTFNLDGGDDCPDWFEMYNSHVDDDIKHEFSFFINCGKRIEWKEIN